MNKHKLLLIIILGFFLITRLYKITEVPASLYWDEASIGYNAYAVLADGKDEWGKSWPLHFRAFGEFKLPVYVYSVAIVQSVFGPGELSVRLPAVLFSLGTILLVYLLTLRVIKDERAALFSSFFLTISPWFFIFSRVGYEVSGGLMFYLLGIYALLLIPKRHIYLVISSISFILSMYSYNGFRVIVPLTLPLLVLVFFKQRLLYPKKIIVLGLVSVAVLFLSTVPIYRFMVSENNANRLQSVGIFNDSLNKNNIPVTFLKNYLSHFSFDYLFITGDKNLRSHTGSVGQFYILDLFLLLTGAVLLIRQKQKVIVLFALAVAMIGFIPAAITKESPHALRSLSVVPFFYMFLGNAVFLIGKIIKHNKYFYITVIGAYLIYFAFFYNDYMNNYKVNSSSDWQYGYKRIFLDYSREFDKYDHVIISDRYAQPYIFSLFYLQYDVLKFRSQVQYNPPDKWGFSTVAAFNNFIFKQVEDISLPTGKLLVFASTEDKLKSFPEKANILNLDGSVSFYVYEFNK